MIRVKVTPMGGYVTGDGELPCDPDTFFKLCVGRMLEHKVSEWSLTDEEARTLLAEQRDKLALQVEEAEAVELPNDTAVGGIIAAMPGGREPEGF